MQIDIELHLSVSSMQQQELVPSRNTIGQASSLPEIGHQATHKLQQWGISRENELIDKASPGTPGGTCG